MSYLAIAAIVKNEALCIEEWIAFHQLVGVEEFHIYDNGSTDDTRERIEGVPGVYVASWPGPCQQLAAYADALAGAQARWLAFLDVDEFLLSPGYLPLPTVLRDYENHDAIGVCWAVYGTSDIKHRPNSVLSAYLRRTRQTDPINHHVKSIVQPGRVPAHQPLDPHHFLCGGVDERGRPLDGPMARSVTWERLRINHYISKSITEAKAKMERPRADNGELRSLNLCKASLNAHVDNITSPYVELVQERILAMRKP